MNFKKIVLILSAVVLTTAVHAQFSLRLTEPNGLLKQCMEQYELGHYTKANDLAQQYLSKELLKTQRTPQGAQDDLYEATAIFYKHLSAIGKSETGAINELALFLAETPFASLQQYGYFKLAKSLFAQQSFAQAIPYYEKANINYLSNEEITQRNFELAYCYLLDNQLDKVNPLFASVKDVKGEYFSPGNYYHGVLAYYRGDYDAALKSFEAVKQQKEYQEIVPFYIAELQYFKGDKDKALSQATAYMKNKNGPYYNEMSQLAGQIYYEKGEFAKAQKYLSQYVNQQAEVRNEDYFRMGYVKYQMGELAEAIRYFEQVKDNGTPLYAQSLYYLGLSSLKNGMKKQAYEHFKTALRTNKLGSLEEDVRFNTAKLSYDLEGDATTETRLEGFVKKYPNSKYYSDAIEMLALHQIKSKNFEKASLSLQRLGKLSPIFEGVYQKVHYARGVQLLKNGLADLAIPYFVESEKYPVDENLKGLSEFWKTESYYRLGKYDEALAASYRFIDKPGAGNSRSLVQNSFLTNAYIYMHQNNKEKLSLAYTNYLDTTAAISAAEALADMDSIKPNYVPSHVPFVEANPYVFIYQLPSRQVDFVYKPLPLTPMAYSNVNSNTIRNNFVKAGFGNLRTTLLEVGYDVSRDVNSDMYLSLSHRASKSNLYLQQASMNEARLLTKNQFGNYDAEIDFTLARNVFRPYGGLFVEQNADIKNRFVDGNILARIKPIVGQLGGIDYSAITGVGVYNILSQGGGWSGTELSFLIDAPFSKKITETFVANLGVEAQVNTLLGAGDQPAGLNTGSSFIVLKPSVQKMIDDIELNVGLYPALGKKFHLLPNIAASKYVTPLKAKLGLGVESELIANSYKQFSQVNPFIGLINLEQTKRTLYYAQGQGAIYNNFNYNLKVGGGRINNLPLYQDDPANRTSFAMRYANANIFSLLANVEYHLNYKTNAGVQFMYEPILNSNATASNNMAYYIPAQLNAYAKYSYNHRLNLRGDLFVRTPTRASLPQMGSGKKLNGAFDLNIHTNYLITNKWTAFAELNNLLGNGYQRWLGYPTFKTNALVGIMYSFNNSLSDAIIKR